MIDASRIASLLYQGSAPPLGPALKLAGFDVVVLCAEELRREQPLDRFYGCDVILCPLDDSPLTPQYMARAEAASFQVAAAIVGGRRVLVTCAMGLNRSGLVTALALQKVTGKSGKECVRIIRERRPPQKMGGVAFFPLSNASFVRAIEAIPAARRRVA